MKKLITTVIVIISCIMYSYAQGQKGYIGISAGPNLPVGEYASTDFSSDAAGWAKLGVNIDISFAYQFGEGNLGIAALLRGQVNPTDAQAMEDFYNNSFSGANWTVNGESWKLGGLLLGGYGSFPISEKTSFDTRVMAGFLNSALPSFTVTATNDGSTGWYKHESVTAISFAYLAGVGLKFDISPKLYLLTNVDYWASNPKFKDVKITASDGTTSTDSFEPGIGSFSVSVGIALKL